ncbi:phenylalanine--tRNA ligase beta subunit [Oratosquilla oratoria]|uniref:phenylalanine--tRNA ligase beta subunit n=1 Tax=Oratosquilla oratoria TaxID=337810 RepID=UPI003F764D93
MPTISVDRDLLFKSLGRSYSQDDFEELCFQYGIELDDVVEDPEKGVTYKIEIGANRYDLLCLEGLSQALNVFLGNSKMPRYQLVSPREPGQYKLIVKPDTKQVRPYVVGAVLRNMKFTQTIYDSFIELQDKLHQNVARKRTLVAIGTHDLDTITGPFIYDARKPTDISFVPLNQAQVFRADKLLDHYSQDSHLREYVPIIKDKPVYPVITDQKGVVLSLPPIINGNHSKITLETRNVFIECTATDRFKAQLVLDTLVCMFSRYCEQPYTVEPVEVEYPSGEKIVYPKLQYRDQEASVSYCNALVGINESQQNISKMLSKMSLEVKSASDNKIVVEVPPTRYDVLHECDIAEDLAVAYGFDKLAEDMKLPPTNTIAGEFELNYLSDKLRHHLTHLCYTEAATFSLCSKMDMGDRIQVNLSNEPWVKIGNPKTVDCEAVRISLLPGLLKTTAANKHVPLPIRFFEVADVALRDVNADLTRGTGARNERHLCAINYNVRPNMEVIQGLLDHIMKGLKVPFAEDNGEKGYYLVGKDHPSYMPGFCGQVILNGVEVGRLGVIHPTVILNFSLNNPAGALELNLQKILSLLELH